VHSLCGLGDARESGRKPRTSPPGFPGFAALNPGYVPFLGRFSDFGFCCNLLKIAAALEKSAAAPMARARRTPTLE
jgi:hypothetical protein